MKNDQFVEQYLEENFGEQEAYLTVNHFMKVTQDIAGLSTLGEIVIDDEVDTIVHEEVKLDEPEESEEGEDEEGIEEDKMDML